MKIGIYLPINRFGEGLCIVHPMGIAVSHKALIGKNCKIHHGVTIGMTPPYEVAPRLGDNIFIGAGAKIIGGGEIADFFAIGANAGVVQSFIEPGVTIAGNPARKISNKGTRDYHLGSFL